MAVVVPVPGTFLTETDAGHPGEARTLAALRDDLPDDYHVFHGCHWALDTGRCVDFGEIDFVVVNPAGDILLIEQKNGPLIEEGGRLIKQYERGKAKDVGSQIHRAVERVKEKFGAQHPGMDLGLSYLVVCPEHAIANVNAVGLERRHVCDAHEYPHIARKVMDLLPEGDPDEGRFRTVMDFFSDVWCLVPDIHAQLEMQSAYCLRHRGTLADFLTSLEMNPFRLRVEGIAGCGKSLYATALYESRVRRGERPLLVCFNRSLAENFAARLRAGGYVNTFHGLCNEFLKSRDSPMDFRRMNEPGFWQELLERVMAEPVPPEWRFDAAIVDEGQDFDPEWFEILRLFLKEPGHVFWLEDPMQNLYGKPRLGLEGFVTFRSRSNFRSPQSIAEFIRACVDVEFSAENPHAGMGAEWHEYDNEEEQAALIERIVKRLRKDGFDDSQIAILSVRGVSTSRFREADRIGSVALRRWYHDDEGRQQFTGGTVLFDSVYRFKGNEAPAVILVEVGEGGMSGEVGKRVLFCGMTRATLRLDVVAKRGTRGTGS